MQSLESTCKKSYFRLVTNRVTEFLFNSYIQLQKGYGRRLLIATPWISTMSKQKIPLNYISKKAKREKTPITLVTKNPDYLEHKKAVELLKSDGHTVYLNNNLHAKIYVLLEFYNDFALISSANLTSKGLTADEVGIYINGRGKGSNIIRQLTELILIRLKKKRLR